MHYTSSIEDYISFSCQFLWVQFYIYIFSCPLYKYPISFYPQGPRPFAERKDYNILNDQKYTLADFREDCKKVKIEVTGPKKAKFLDVFRAIYQKKTILLRSCDFIFNFFALKNPPEYSNPFGHFEFYEILVELHLDGVLEVHLLD